MATTAQSVTEVCAAARDAARVLAVLDSDTKNAALLAIAGALEERTPEILEANERDMEAGRDSGLSGALLDRLSLDAGRVRAIADGVRTIAALPDPVGEVIDGFRLPNGLDVRKVRVPLAAVAAEAVEAAGVPAAAVSLVAGGGRAELGELATQTGVVDLLIPRGGEGLKAALKDVATVPVIYAASGNCHVYVDARADLDMAHDIVVNAKTQRPGVCNAAETLLVHRDVAPAFLPRILRTLREAGVELRADGRSRAAAGELADSLLDATDEDWDTEFLAMVLAVGVVDSVEEAVEHVNRHGSGHSEAIVTPSIESAHAFERGVDAACVYVNASTRFTDGFEFGMGAEIGNSTQKLHARGPIGMRELCTYKYVVEGSGQVRG